MRTANKYNKLLGLLRQKIFSGEYGVDGRLPSERDLSEQLGYSRVTVRAVLQEFVNLGLVEKRLGAGNYLTSWLRSSGAVDSRPVPVGPKGKVLRFGLIINKSMVCSLEEDPYYNMLMLGFINARHSGRSFEIETVSISQDDTHDNLFDEFRKQGIAPESWDGMIIATQLQPKDIEFLDSLTVPYVLQGEQQDSIFRPVVTSDNYHGAFNAARHLLETGRKNPLLIYHAHQDSRWMELRLLGIYKCYRINGIELVDGNLLPIESGPEASESRQIQSRFENGQAYDSVICFGDRTTVSVMEVIQKKLKRDIPGDIAVISFDTYAWMDLAVSPAVTCVSQQFVRIGEYCINELYRQIDYPDAVTTIQVIMPIITLRDSTK